MYAYCSVCDNVFIHFAMKARLLVQAGQLYSYDMSCATSREHEVKTSSASTFKALTLRNAKGMPFVIYRFFRLLLSIAATVSRFKMNRVSRRADSNGAYPASVARKMAKLFTFSEGRSQRERTIDVSRRSVLVEHSF